MIPGNTVHDILYRGIKNHPDKTALIFEGKEYSFRGMNSRAFEIAAQLHHHDMSKNVVILLGNRPEAIFSIFGVIKAARTFVILNTSTKAKTIREIMDDALCNTIITDDAHLKEVSHALRSDDHVINVDTPYDYEHDPMVITNMVEPRAIMYTSGSTGKPKGVVCPDDCMMAAIDIINQYLHHDENDRIFTALPLSHGYGLYQVLAPLSVGATVILEKGFLVATPILKRLRDLKATGFATVPSMLSMIFKNKDWPEYLQSLRYLTNAGAGLPPAYFKDLMAKLPDTVIMPMYGQTECVRALYFPAGISKHGQRIESTGIGIPRTNVYLDDGELIVQGPTVMEGYWNKPEETERVFFTDEEGNRCLRTSDLFRQDEDGLFYYVGRKDDMVKIKGERVSPQTLDNALYEMEGVIDAASFGMEDDAVWGNRLVTYVATETLTKQEIMRYIKANLEPFMLPKDVVLVDEMPKTPNGKISRKLLKELYLETH